MELIINEDNLQLSEIQEFSSKVRAILVDENNNILISKYGDVILLPGGKVDDDETISNAITRELNEELGQNYNSEELEYFLTLNYYQKGYLKRDGTVKNRLVQIHYFMGLYKDIKKELQRLTEKERKDNFRLELVLLEDLEKVVLNNINNNPRNIYFKKELLVVLDSYKNIKCGIGLKKFKSK